MQCNMVAALAFRTHLCFSLEWKQGSTSPYREREHLKGTDLLFYVIYFFQLFIYLSVLGLSCDMWDL